ncbi:FG-GAP repeat domain-containing protein [Desulfobaculum bizertense]|uniref:TolB amino-terminal domain-containing protein n=1 Tax=Desulfobaculum bizertense DSM 18034 TaxID=1121442 RepID=A0A1T4X3V0_9BACT|nr:VCBS repeat-containing protein [Desulfobaculum bizertense]UIJ37385.1 VCBS repeat-containing protein [Desulfobaculum bizertense]SKA84282.1 TolB amino-terminal domain-containing protein [Desulfobaculum bizertense DSM 18034]
MGCVRVLAALLMALVLLVPGRASAEEIAKTFAVLPFTINGPEKYQYLSRGIQDMMISRLSWGEHLDHIGKDKLASISAAPESEKDAAQVLSSLGANYLVWGSVTILGDQCSIDLRVKSDDNKFWPRNQQTDIGGLIPALEGMAKSVNSSIFMRAEPKAPQATAQAETPVNRMNPELIFNENKQNQKFYLNPQFRYSGGTDTPGRWRSPRLPFTGQGMIVGDPDGDGQNEVLFIDKHDIYVYRWDNARLQLIDHYEGSRRVELLNVNLIDLDRSGKQTIAVSGIIAHNLDDAMSRNSPNQASSLMLTFENGKLKVQEDGLKFFMNVVKVPPTFQPVLLAQKAGRLRIFDSPVHELIRMSGKFQLGKRVSLPEKANVFNVTFVTDDDDAYKLLLVNSSDNIEVYTPRNELIATTLDQFAGSQLGFVIPDTMRGFGTSADQYTNMYYIPLRLVTTDLNSDGKMEVLVNKNISVAAQFFERYRFFPNGEIHSLFWDGVGMSLSWKTRRIKGTVCDYGLADIDNDGTMDLYVALNTYPGDSGFGKRRAMIVSYRLDQSQMDPNTPIVREN